MNGDFSIEMEEDEISNQEVNELESNRREFEVHRGKEKFGSNQNQLDESDPFDDENDANVYTDRRNNQK